MGKYEKPTKQKLNTLEIKIGTRRKPESNHVLFLSPSTYLSS
jgi:hypothetical protein